MAKRKTAPSPPPPSTPTPSSPIPPKRARRSGKRAAETLETEAAREDDDDNDSDAVSSGTPSASSASTVEYFPAVKGKGKGGNGKKAAAGRAALAAGNKGSKKKVVPDTVDVAAKVSSTKPKPGKKGVQKRKTVPSVNEDAVVEIDVHAEGHGKKVTKKRKNVPAPAAVTEPDADPEQAADGIEDIPVTTPKTPRGGRGCGRGRAPAGVRATANRPAPKNTKVKGPKGAPAPVATPSLSSSPSSKLTSLPDSVEEVKNPRVSELKNSIDPKQEESDDSDGDPTTNLKTLVHWAENVQPMPPSHSQPHYYGEPVSYARPSMANRRFHYLHDASAHVAPAQAHFQLAANPPRPLPCPSQVQPLQAAHLDFGLSPFKFTTPFSSYFAQPGGGIQAIEARRTSAREVAQETFRSEEHKIRLEMQHRLQIASTQRQHSLQRAGQQYNYEMRIHSLQENQHTLIPNARWFNSPPTGYHLAELEHQTATQSLLQEPFHHRVQYGHMTAIEDEAGPSNVKAHGNGSSPTVASHALAGEAHGRDRADMLNDEKDSFQELVKQINTFLHDNQLNLNEMVWSQVLQIEPIAEHLAFFRKYEALFIAEIVQLQHIKVSPDDREAARVEALQNHRSLSERLSEETEGESQADNTPGPCPLPATRRVGEVNAKAAGKGKGRARPKAASRGYLPIPATPGLIKAAEDAANLMNETRRRTSLEEPKTSIPVEQPPPGKKQKRMK